LSIRWENYKGGKKPGKKARSFHDIAGSQNLKRTEDKPHSRLQPLNKKGEETAQTWTSQEDKSQGKVQRREGVIRLIFTHTKTTRHNIQILRRGNGVDEQKIKDTPRERGRESQKIKSQGILFGDTA